MKFRNRVKNRKLKRYINYIIRILKLRSFNFKTSQKIILFGVLLNFISLFFPWVINYGLKYDSFNSFSSISGRVGIIIFLILGFLFFNLFSINSKEKLQLHTSIHFRDYPITIIAGVIIFLLNIISINFIDSLQFFSSTIIHGNGLILSITSSIVILLGGIIQRTEFNRLSTRIKLYESKDDIELLNSDKLKDNMKLPF